MTLWRITYMRGKELHHQTLGCSRGEVLPHIQRIERQIARPVETVTKLGRSKFTATGRNRVPR